MYMCFNDMGVCVARGTTSDEVRRTVEQLEQMNWDQLSRQGFWISQPL